MNPTSPTNPFPQLAARFHLSEIYAFGSRATEIHAVAQGSSPATRHPASDVDIAVEPVPGHRLSAKEKVQLTIAFEDLFRAHRVDLVVLSETDPFLALDIIKKELLYCRDEDRQAEHELEILRRAGDLAFHEREKRKLTLSAGVQEFE